MSNSHYLAFAKFGLVGSITAVIYFLVMWLIEAVLGASYAGAVSLAYLLSTIFQFAANRHFTFAAAHGSSEGQILRYMCMWLINYLITILIVSICVEKLQLSPYVGVCIAVVLTMSVGYFLARYWVFKVKEGAL